MCARIVLAAEMAFLLRDDEVSFSRYHQSRIHPRVFGAILVAKVASVRRDDEGVLGNR